MMADRREYPQSIGVFAKYGVYITAPPGAEVFQQLFGGGPPRAGDGEQRIEKMRLILASGAAAGSPVLPFPGNLEHF